MRHVLGVLRLGEFPESRNSPKRRTPRKLLLSWSGALRAVTFRRTAARRTLQIPLRSCSPVVAFLLSCGLGGLFVLILISGFSVVPRVAAAEATLASYPVLAPAVFLPAEPPVNATVRADLCEDDSSILRKARVGAVVLVTRRVGGECPSGPRKRFYVEEGVVNDHFRAYKIRPRKDAAGTTGTSGEDNDIHLAVVWSQALRDRGLRILVYPETGGSVVPDLAPSFDYGRERFWQKSRLVLTDVRIGLSPTIVVLAGLGEEVTSWPGAKAQGRIVLREGGSFDSMMSSSSRSRLSIHVGVVKQ